MSYLHQRFQLLCQPRFRWFVLSCFFGSFGTGLTHIALSWLVLKTHNSVGGVAISMICFWLPNALLGPYFGVLVDRYSRKWCIAISTAIRGVMLISFVLYFWYGMTANVIYTLCFISGVFFSFFLPAVMAFVREIVRRDELLYANATIDLAFEIGNVTGMGSAGVLIAWFSATTVMLINGVTFLISAFFIMLIRCDIKNTNKASRNLYREFKEGLAYIANNKPLLAIYMVQALFLVEFMTAPVLLAPFAKNVLHATVSQFGTIEATLSIGVVLGGFITPWFANRYGYLKMLLVMSITLAVLFAVFSLNRAINEARVIYFIIGFAVSVWPLLITKAQELTNIELQGRVQSCFISVSSVLVILVYLLVGASNYFLPVSKLYGLEVLFSVLALIMLWKCRRLFVSEL